jgi:hypothetical protein
MHPTDDAKFFLQFFFFLLIGKLIAVLVISYLLQNTVLNANVACVPRLVSWFVDECPISKAFRCAVESLSSCSCAKNTKNFLFDRPIRLPVMSVTVKCDLTGTFDSV